MIRLIHHLKEIILKSGDATLPYFTNDRDKNTSVKTDGSPLTKADQISEEIICSELEKLTPRVPIISEERGEPDFETRKNWNQFWLVDPLDGTKEFIAGIPEYTINIAFIDSGIPVMGLLYAPALGHLYWGAQNQGSWKENLRARHSPTKLQSRPKNKKRIAVESRFHKSKFSTEILKQYDIIQMTEVGSSLKLAYLAEGKADIYLRLTPIREWDVAAGDALFRWSGYPTPRVSKLVYNSKDLKFAELHFGID